jgi:hypothetical protein
MEPPSWCSSSLPPELLHIVFGFLNARELLTVAHASRTLGEAVGTPHLWQSLLVAAVGQAVDGVTRSWVAEKSIEDTRILRSEIQLEVLANAMALTVSFSERTGDDSPKTALFLALAHVAEFTVLATTKRHFEGSPLLLSVDHRAYDVTTFVDDHPGGATAMRRFRGRDATEVFNVFGHSKRAHALMHREFLRFDAGAFAGVPGLLFRGLRHDNRFLLPNEPFWSLRRQAAVAFSVGCVARAARRHADRTVPFGRLRCHLAGSLAPLAVSHGGGGGIQQWLNLAAERGWTALGGDDERTWTAKRTKSALAVGAFCLCTRLAIQR